MRASEPLRHGAQGRIPALQNNRVPVVSIVVPFWGVPYRILIIYLVKPKKGTTMETIGTTRGLRAGCSIWMVVKIRVPLFGYPKIIGAVLY